VSLSAVEALVGALLVTGVVAGFVVGSDGTGTDADEAQLDRYAADAARLLATEPAAAGNGTRLEALTASNGSFGRVQTGVRRRLDAVLPDNVVFRVETPHGTVGYPPPTGETGQARRVTPDGTVVVEVWYV
jgi:DNA-binding beta-propeller fold protein YncE